MVLRVLRSRATCKHVLHFFRVVDIRSFRTSCVRSSDVVRFTLDRSDNSFNQPNLWLPLVVSCLMTIQERQKQQFRYLDGRYIGWFDISHDFVSYTIYRNARTSTIYKLEHVSPGKCMARELLKWHEGSTCARVLKQRAAIRRAVVPCPREGMRTRWL